MYKPNEGLRVENAFGNVQTLKDTSLLNEMFFHSVFVLRRVIGEMMTLVSSGVSTRLNLCGANPVPIWSDNALDRVDLWYEPLKEYIKEMYCMTAAWNS